MNQTELKKKSKVLKPMLRIGKNGLNASTIEETKKLLKIKKLVKIKILKNCEEDINSIIPRITEETGSTLIHKIGKVFSIYKR